MQGIYRILNLIDGKSYIGSAINIEQRWKAHKKDLGRNCHSNSVLQNVYNKYGAEYLILEIVEEVKGSRKELYDREQYYINKEIPEGRLYNISMVVGNPPILKGPANGMYGKNHSFQTREAQSQIRRDYFKVHPGTFKGKKHTIEAKHKNSEKHKEYFLDHRPWNFGIPRTEECKQKISSVKQSHHIKLTKEHIQAIKDANKNNSHNAKSYPAFYNESTKEFIPSGENLWQLCKQYNLKYQRMWEIKSGTTITHSIDGWRLAIPEEVEQYESIAQ